ncbi:mismatch-specific DNA-glycosylase [Tumebacillus permanentifrigoris]|uniref:G/U mismatch-specific uracil-DNA glycosylase n=1 Tax=Tumebacillus permanentifrigoris TaxID=378543 RepID=A0A316DB10_9BACL|nr:mismatch-specific DNA-glycosylase [Tumebacillus permanentifrigoris]PWK13796.1 G/U mismatch-specific uracil-DNA glycosylase [Tumebacillus permanentifrigoris]
MPDGLGYIPDSLAPGLKVLFIGYNPSLRSGEVGHNYAGKNNRFWKLLHESGLTVRRMHPTEDRDLLHVGYGFTNIVSRPTRRADEITKDEYAQGRLRLQALLREHRPQVACFVGKGVYEQYAQVKNIRWGAQPHPTIEGVIDFVAPSSSGLVRMPYPAILQIYHDLWTVVDK